jgi:arylsulfatase A-like enzyme
VPTPPGKSLSAAFAKDGAVPHDELWWCHEGNRAVRAGDWKLVAAGTQAPWELYDLRRDRCETKDLAGEHGDKVRELEQLWNKRMNEFRALALKDPPAP